MKPLRLALFGFGTVGQWLAEALHTQQAWLQQEFGLIISIVGFATAHHGLMYCGDGLDIPTLLDLVATRQPLTVHPSSPIG
jgi:homoserine dehydrogenase